jgi:valyl-tRNA synthetase
MPDDDVEKFLAEKKTFESKRQELIKEVLRQKEAAIKAFDEKLAKLGYDGDHAPKRSHHSRRDDAKPEQSTKSDK